ncbi:MAG: hypothetical protein ACPGGK_14825, partial [Pikeienuella sp.]
MRFVLIILLFTLTLPAPNTATARDFALPFDDECPIELPERGPDETGWTDSERWAWQQICVGHDAYMFAAPDGKVDGEECNPADIDADKRHSGDYDHRKLSSEFLSTILTRPQFTEVIARPKVQIRCAWIDWLDLSYQEVTPSLFITRSWLPSGADLLGARFEGALGFQTSTFEKELNADSISVGSYLFLRGGASFKDVILRNADINGSVIAIGSVFDGKFNMNSSTIGDSLYLNGGASFKELDLNSAQVGGNVEAIGSKFHAPLKASNITVGGGLLLSGGATFTDVVLRGATVKGIVSANGSTFEDELNMNRITVGGSLFLRNGATFSDVNLLRAKVEGSVETNGSSFSGELSLEAIDVGASLFLREGASFNDIVLLNAQVGGSLQLGGANFDGLLNATGINVRKDFLLTHVKRGEASWGENARLILRNAQVGAVQAALSGWPAPKDRALHTDLTGFHYERLGGLHAQEMHTMEKETADALIAWLDAATAHGGYDPGPYVQLASALEASGQAGKASAILYAKHRHRDSVVEASFTVRWLLRPAERWIIGYGVYPFRALIWFGGLVAVGIIIGFASNAASLIGWRRKFWFSFE